MSAAKTKKKTDGKPVLKASHYDVLRAPVITEKSTMANEQGKVVFKISPCATKTSIREAVEGLFGVKVVKVNTIKIPGKTKLFRGVAGKRQDVRKAIVTLAEGQSIDVASGVK